MKSLKYRILNIIGNLALIAIFIGICVSGISLGSKIIWGSIYTFFLCFLEMLSTDEYKKAK